MKCFVAWGTILLLLVEGVDDAGVYWELIAFWISSCSTMDVSKKATAVPSASLCTRFLRYRRGAVMQFNDSEMQMAGKRSETEKDLYIDLKNYMLYTYMSCSFECCLFFCLSMPSLFCTIFIMSVWKGNVLHRFLSEVVKSFSKINSSTKICFLG